MALGTAFCEARTGTPPSPELDRALARAVEEGRAAWPGIHVEETAFAAYLGERVTGGDPVQALADVHVGDVWLACACAQRSREALAVFADTQLSRIAGYLAKSRAEALADDVRQILLARFFVAEDGRPKILEYTGRGSLGAWVRVAAVRTAISLQRAPRHEAEPCEELAAPMDPELDALRVKMRGAFEAALAEAFDELSDRDHALMRLHYAKRIAVESLARVYNVHRVSVSRWLSEARAQILASTRAKLHAALRLSDSEFVSMTRLVQSQLDVSLGHLLETREPRRENSG